MATGSLGQGLCAGIGIALNARRIGSDYRTYVLMGDGEVAEGSVWEAAAAGEFFALDNLVGITDVNALGQSRATQHAHDLGSFERRWRAFGWHTVAIDGHDMDADPGGAGRSAGHQGPADDDPGAHPQGPGRELPGRSAELARQGA